GAGFFGIGDPRQSIYGFRGALKDSARSLARKWPEIKIVHLLENYRSSQKILDFSKALFPKDPAFEARKNIDGQIYFFQAVDSIQENQWLAQKISSLLGGSSHWQKDASGQDHVLAPGDMAVLVRFKGLIPELEKEMQRRGIPVSVPENQPYFMDPRVELILRAVARVMGVREDKKVFDCPEKILAGGPERMAAYLEDVPPFDRMFWHSRSFKELEKEYKRLGGWTELINEIILESELSQVEARAQKVRIMTMHAAKGLEFDTVFIPCLEDGIMPFAGAGMLLGKMSGKKQRQDPEEEKRLLYVSLTRAKRSLYLSLAGSRKIFGRQLNLKESRFLKELPLEMARVTRGRIGKSRKVKQMRLG
ncbi:MAG: 3'-5' exonuclease, partial [Desulfonatronovibrionaceae bacterium]